MGHSVRARDGCHHLPDSRGNTRSVTVNTATCTEAEQLGRRALLKARSAEEFLKSEKVRA